MNATSPTHKDDTWSQRRERGGIRLLALTFWLYRHLGRKLFGVVLLVVIFWYWVFSPSVRRHSRAYLARVAEDGGLPPPTLWQTYQHLHAFGISLIDKMAAWQNSGVDGAIGERALTLHGHEIVRAHYGQGAIFMVSHFGNIELLHAIKSDHHQKVTILVYQKHAEAFNAFLQKINPSAGVRLLSVADMGVQTAEVLQERLDAGEWLIIAADRVPVVSERKRLVNLLGQSAYFPEGAWHLAHLFGVPVFAVFCYRQGGSFELHAHPLADRFHLSRQNRDVALQDYMQRYADLLAHHIRRAPYQWFNFYDFWAK